jgi:subtilisin family serine protease
MLRAAAMLGVVAVAAAGNCGDDGDGTPNWQEKKAEGGQNCRQHNARQRPALYAEVIAVAAVDHEGHRIDVSSANENVDVAAPGGSIRSTHPCSASGCTTTVGAGRGP